MKKIRAHQASRPRSEIYVRIAWVYAFILVVMAFSQLIGFEKFIPLIDDYRLAGGYGTATLIAGLIVIVEIFSLPFLLRMRLSDLMRWFSFGCSVFVPLVWVILSLHSLVITPVKNGGILGVHVNVGIMTQLFLALFLAVVSMNVVFGMIPKRTRSR